MAASTLTDQMIINYWRWEVQLTDADIPVPEPHHDTDSEHPTNIYFLMDPADVNKNDFGANIIKGTPNPIEINATTPILVSLQGSFFDDDDQAHVVGVGVVADKGQLAAECYNAGIIDSKLSVDGIDYASVSGELCLAPAPGQTALAPNLESSAVEYRTAAEFSINIPANSHKRNLDPPNFGMIHDHHGMFNAGSHGYWALLPGFAPNTTHTITYYLNVKKDNQNCRHGEGSPNAFESSVITYHLST
jgi:hypothetical protein